MGCFEFLKLAGSLRGVFFCRSNLVLIKERLLRRRAVLRLRSGRQTLLLAMTIHSQIFYYPQRSGFASAKKSDYLHTVINIKAALPARLPSGRLFLSSAT